MTRHVKLFEAGAGVVLVSAAAVALSLAFGGGATDEARVPRQHPAATTERTTARSVPPTTCDYLPDNYVVRDELPPQPSGAEVNAWAAGDAAVARYFNSLVALCAVQP